MKIKMEIYSPKVFPSTELHVTDCGYEKCQPSESFGPYKRDYFLIHYIIEGKGEYFYNGKVYNLDKNQGFCIFPDDSTTYKANKENPWYYYWIGFKGTEANNILKSCNITKENPIFTYEKDDKLKKYITKLFHESKMMQWNEYIMLGFLYLFFAYLYQNRLLTNNDTKQNFINKAIEFIEENFMLDITIDDIAKNLFINRSYLYKIFKAKLNTSPSDYLQNYRLNKASRLLILSNYTITDIIGYCGFKSSSIFCKVFKKKFDMSPLKYRKKMR